MAGRLASGSVFAGYRVDAEAGRGGMGVVYRATEIASGRAVALKLIAAGAADDPDFHERFRREARQLAAVEHEHVVPFLGSGEDDGQLYVAMGWVDGTDLRRLIAESGPLAPATAVRIVQQVASALDAAHDRGLVHRDVKAANILVRPGPDGPEAYLTDFGLARSVELTSDRLTRSGGWVGSVDYVAPEQIEDAQIDRRTDVYALGCVLFEAVTGTVPFPRGSEPARLWAHLHETPPSARDRAPAVPGRLDAVIQRALAKESGARWPTAGDFGRAAVAAATDAGRATVAGDGPPPAGEPGAPPREQPAAAGAPAAAGPPPPGAPPPAAAEPPAAGSPVPAASGSGVRRRVPIAAAVVVLALLVAGGVAAVLLTGSDDDPAGRPAAAAPPVRIERVALGPRVAPGFVAAGSQRAYAFNRANGRIVVVDSQSGLVVRSLDAGRQPRDIAIAGDDDGGWIVDGDGWLRRLDVEAGRIVGRPIRVQRAASYAASTGGEDVVVLSRRDDGASLLRVDGARGRAVGRPKEIGGAVVGIAAWSGGDVFVPSAFPPLVERFSASDLADRGMARLRVGHSAANRDLFGDIPAEMAIDDTTSTGWIAGGGGTLLRYDVAGNRQVGRAIDTGLRDAVDIAVADGVVWVPSAADEAVARIDAKSGRPLGRPLRIRSINGTIAIAGDDVWLGGTRDLVHIHT